MSTNHSCFGFCGRFRIEEVARQITASLFPICPAGKSGIRTSEAEEAIVEEDAEVEIEAVVVVEVVEEVGCRVVGTKEEEDGTKTRNHSGVEEGDAESFVVCRPTIHVTRLLDRFWQTKLITNCKKEAKQNWFIIFQLFTGYF